MEPQAVDGLVEVAFGADELFFSATDPGGRIVAGNPVFARVSGYALPELVGRAHNVVRHPDMPRVVFRILWDHLREGRAVAAYVKNRTRDGRPYWVVATATATGSGFLSVRCRPSGPHFPVVRALYDELRAAESGIEAEGGSRNDAIDASAALLRTRLADLGFADYGAFMRAFLPLELECRERELDGTPYWGRLWHDEPGDARERDGGLLATLTAFREACDRMRRLFEHLGAFEALGATLTGRSRDLTGDTRLLSLNALLGAHRLGPSGAALSVVAHLIGVEADRTGQVTDELNRSADGLGALLSEQSFGVSVGRLLAEMAVFYGLEALAGGVRADQEIEQLADALGRSAGLVEGVASTLTGTLASVNDQLGLVTDLLRTLEVLQLNGTIEASRADGAEGVKQLFSEMRERLDSVRAEVEGLAAVSDVAAVRRTIAEATAIRELVSGITDRLRELDRAA